MAKRKVKPIGRVPFAAQYGPERDILEYRIVNFVKGMGRCTVRQAFYSLAMADIISKTQSNYQKVSQVLSDARRGGLIPFSQIWSADDDPAFDGDSHADKLENVSRILDGFVDRLAGEWPSFNVGSAHNHKHAVFVICEHASLVPQIEDAVRNDVVVLSGGGQPSTTLLYNTAEAVKSCGKSPVVLTLSDRDKAGEAIASFWRADLKAWGVMAKFEHLALTKAQVKKYDLPEFGGKTQLEALPLDVFADICHEGTEKYFDSKVDEANRKLRDEGQAKLDAVAEPVMEAIKDKLDELGFDVSRWDV